MFENKKKIIYVTRTEIAGYVVNKSSRKIESQVKTKWNEKNLKVLIKKLVAKLSADEASLLLSADTSYLLHFDKPEKSNGQSEREMVYELIKDQIPEDLADTEWDFREMIGADKHKKIIVFAPVKKIFQLISDGFRETKCKVVAIESVKIAKLRDPNPVIGIALKEDLAGKDENSLNIALFSHSNLQSKEKVQRQQIVTAENVNAQSDKQPVVKKSYLITLLIVLILGVGTIISLIFARSDNKDSKTEKAVVVEIPSVSPTIAITQDPKSEIDFASISVQVLNGSGVEGEASYVAGLLEEEGFEEIDIGNAESQEAVSTLIQVKDGEELTNLGKIIEEILSEYNTEITEPLTEESEFDLLIIVGRKNEKVTVYDFDTSTTKLQNKN